MVDRARGRPTADTSWRVGIRHPESTLELATLVTACGPLGVATSATYERGAHIIDPRTHQPTTDLASATVSIGSRRTPTTTPT